MKNFIRSKKWTSIICSLLAIVIGVLLLVYNEAVPNAISVILGAMLVLYSVVTLIIFIARKAERGFGSWIGLMIGLVILAVGIWVFCNPEKVVTICQYAIGGLLVIDGIFDLSGAISIKSLGGRMRFHILFAVLTIILGAIIIFNPTVTAGIPFIFIGISMIFGGLTDIIVVLRLSHAIKLADMELNAIETEGTEVD